MEKAQLQTQMTSVMKAKDDLQAQVDDLVRTNRDKSAMIASLQSSVTSLQERLVKSSKPATVKAAGTKPATVKPRDQVFGQDREQNTREKEDADEVGDRALAGSTDYLFDGFGVFGVDGLAAGGALLEEPLAGAVDGLAGDAAGAPEDPAAASFFSPACGLCFLSFGRRLHLVRVIGHVPAAPLEHDARRGDEAANRFAASLAGGQRVVLHALFHFELIRTTVALILINRHRWSSHSVTVTGPSPSLLQLLQRAPQPLQSVRDRVHARGIGEANVPLAAKRFARHDRDLRGLEEIGREVRR